MTSADDVIASAQHLADTVLFPAAEEVDQVGIPRSHLDALGAAGLFDLRTVPGPTARRVLAAVASGCGATFFVWVQHHGAMRQLAETSNTALRDAHLDEARTGASVAGIAYAHLRRAGDRAVTATRDGDGWRLDGFAPWTTSWGIAGQFAVAAATPDDELVWLLLPGTDRDGLEIIDLSLAVFATTGTVAMRFDGCSVSDALVLSTENLTAWRAADRRKAAIGQPAVLGVAQRAIALLNEHGDAAGAASLALSAALADRWDRDDELLVEAAGLPPVGGVESAEGEAWIAAASDHRAACLELAQRATTTLLAATGGRGMDLTNPAQRLAREAAFFVIQAQTADGRAATLRRATG